MIARLGYKITSGLKMNSIKIEVNWYLNWYYAKTIIEDCIMECAYKSGTLSK